MNCRLGRLEEVKSYLERGGDPNVRDVKNRGAVAKAAEYAHSLKLVRLLVKHGADTAGVEDHPLVLKATGGPKLSLRLEALRDRYTDVLTGLECSGFEFSGIDDKEAKALKELNVPDALIDFVRFAWPAKSPSTIGFHDVSAIKAKIAVIPADQLHPLGLVPIASDVGGESYCIDVTATKSLEEMPVYLFHLASYEGSTYPEVLTYGDKIASSWIEFLRHIIPDFDE